MRRKWNKGYAKSIRNYWYFIVLIPRDTLHARIHHGIETIPVPEECIARKVYDRIRELDRFGWLRLDDSIEKRLQLLISLFEKDEPSTADAFRKQLCLVRGFEKTPL